MVSNGMCPQWGWRQNQQEREPSSATQHVLDLAATLPVAISDTQELRAALDMYSHPGPPLEPLDQRRVWVQARERL